MVAIVDRDDDAATQLATELSRLGPGRAIALHADVSRPDEIAEAVSRTVREFDRLDCLINNAGAHPPATSIDDTRLEDVESLFRLNFLGTYAGCKYAVPHLRSTRGTIINISSMTAVLGQDRSSAYAATKGAQLSLTKALAVELGPQGIRVNAVLPSNVDTPLMREWASTLDDPASALARVAALQVFGRMAAPEEIGRVCLFLATQDSSFVTGQGIEVEGGASLDY
jgi:L-fucose dehydrogenase